MEKPNYIFWKPDLELVLLVYCGEKLCLCYPLSMEREVGLRAGDAGL